MLQLTPGSPLELKMQRDNRGALGEQSAISEEAMENLKRLYHFDKPIHVRYGLWLNDLIHLDFGKSFAEHRPVLDMLKERIPVSIAFGLTSILVALFIGIPLGMIAAAYQGRFIDYCVSVILIALYSTPVYVVALVLLTFLGGGDFLDLFPIYGLKSDDYETLSWAGQIWDRAHHFFLPGLCYCLGGLAFIAQQQRSSLLDCMRQDYIRTALSKGLSERSAFLKHAFRNSLIPTVTLLGGMIPGILGGGIIIERIFSIPGLGLLSYEGLLNRDYPVIMANFTISSFLVLLGIFIADFLYVVVDPRITFDERGEG